MLAWKATEGIWSMEGYIGGIALPTNVTLGGNTMSVLLSGCISNTNCANFSPKG